MNSPPNKSQSAIAVRPSPLVNALTIALQSDVPVRSLIQLIASYLVRWSGCYVTTIAGQPGVTGSADGPGRRAAFHAPFLLAREFDGGEAADRSFLIADTSNYTFRRVKTERDGGGGEWWVESYTAEASVSAQDPKFDAVQYMVGLRTKHRRECRFFHPTSLCTDPDGSRGSVYLAAFNAVYHCDGESGHVRWVCGLAAGFTNGGITEAAFHGVSCMRTDYTPPPARITTAVATATASKPDPPCDAGDLFPIEERRSLWIADEYNHAIRRIDFSADGRWVSTAAGSGVDNNSDGSGEKAGIAWPLSIVFIPAAPDAPDTADQPLVGRKDRTGRVMFIASNHEIRRFDTASGQVTTLRLYSTCGDVDCRTGWASWTAIECTRDGSTLLASSSTHHAICTIDPLTGEVMRLAGSASKQVSNWDNSGWCDGDGLSTARFYYPRALLLSVDEKRLFVAEIGGHVIRCIDLH